VNDLLRSQRFRTVATCAGSLIALLVITQFVFPGDNGPSRGTPFAILFSGLVAGLANALVAAGLVVVYRTIRIINFAQTALGVFGASFCFELVRWTPVPFPIAVVLGIALGAAMGVAFDLIFGRRFFNAPRIVLTVLTITATTVAAITIGQLANRLPIFPNIQDRALEDIIGTRSLKPYLPFPGLNFRIGGLRLDFGFPEIFVLEMSIAALVAIGLFFRYTKIGVAVRAISENADRAALLGIGVGTVSTVVWGISGALSATGGIMLGALSVPAAVVGVGATALSLFLPLAAAVLGRMRSIPVAVVAAVSLTVFATAFSYSFPDLAALTTTVFLVVIVVGLLVQRRRIGRSEESGGVSWEAVEELRPVPKELNAVPTVRWGRRVLIAIGVLAVLVWPFVVSEYFIQAGATVALQTIIYLSLVVLTGWAGQISLGQYGFAAVGGVLGAALTAKVGVPFWFAVPIAAAGTGVFAAVVGIPALRIKGLFLAVPTMALAFVIEATLFEDRYFGWLLPKGGVDRPTLFLLDFEDNRSMYYLSVACVVLTVVVVVNLRRSRFGRILIALRENEANVQSFGVSAIRMKIMSFAVSGSIAGFAGAVFVHQQLGVARQSFGGQASLNAFIFTVFGGISTPFGAILGSIFNYLFLQLSSQNDVIGLLIGALQQGGGALLLLFVAPGGLVSLIVRVRDSVLRIIAQRRQLIVPSLFADYDPEALERRLIPLGDRLASSGLAALGGTPQYRLESDLYGEFGVLTPPQGAQRTPSPNVIAAAGASAELGSDAGALTLEMVTGADPAGERDDDGALVGATEGDR
jgi:branched-chain amino acid transport system permease protein